MRDVQPVGAHPAHREAVPPPTFRCPEEGGQQQRSDDDARSLGAWGALRSLEPAQLAAQLAVQLARPSTGQAAQVLRACCGSQQPPRPQRPPCVSLAGDARAQARRLLRARHAPSACMTMMTRRRVGRDFPCHRHCRGFGRLAAGVDREACSMDNPNPGSRRRRKYEARRRGMQDACKKGRGGA